MRRAMPERQARNWRSLVVRIAAPSLAAAASLAAAWPILGNYFYADDFANLVELADFGPRDFVTAPAAGHMYVVRNEIFYLTFRTFGLDPIGYFATALATHVVNVLLLFALVRRLTGSALLAVFGAVLFGVSPANVGTLGWYSVYGHALAATFILGAMLLVVPRPLDRSPLATPAAAGAACCMLAASQCFGTGTAVAIVFPLLVVLLRPAAFRNAGVAAALIAVPVLVVASWFAMHAYTTRLNPAGTAGLEGLLGLAADARSVGWMTLHVFALGAASLVLGPAYPLSRYPDAVSIATVVCFSAAVAAAFRTSGAQARRSLTAFLAAALACYLAVAAGRAALFAAVAHEGALQAFAAATRYQYLAQICLSVVLCLVLAEAARRLPLAERTKRLLLGGWAAWAAVSGIVLRPPVDHFDAERARRRGGGPDRRAGSPCVPGLHGVPVRRARGAVARIPRLSRRLHAAQRLDVMEGRRVLFVSSDATLLARRQTAGRTRRLLVRDGECPPRPGLPSGP